MPSWQAGQGGSLSVASPVLERASRGRWLALFTLAAANLALIGAVAGGFTALADIIAPLTGHLIGIGLTASLALLMRRWVPAILAAGVVATAALHVWLGLAWCCAAPQATTQTALSRLALHTSSEHGLTVLALNTWHVHGDARRLERYLATGPADVVVLSEFGPDKRALLANLKAAYPFQVDCADQWACSLALLSRLPLEAAGVGRGARRRHAGLRMGQARRLADGHRHAPAQAESRSLAARATGVGADAARAQHRWSAGPRRRPQHVALVERVPQAARRHRARSREH